jgi:hypothetical protein
VFQERSRNPTDQPYRNKRFDGFQMGSGTSLPAYLVKARVKLKLQQAEMRARPRCDISRPSQKTPVEPNELKRMIVATILAHQRHWSAAHIARHFGWVREDVERWLEAGKPLL